MRLNELSDNPGATKNRTRLGRGPGSGKGKTAGRGVKGQKSRSGVAIKGFEGGQMPLHMRLPKRGFTPHNQSRYAELNIGKLQAAIDAKKIDAKKALDEDALVAAGVVRRKRDGIRLLAKGTLKAKVSLSVAGATKAAIEAVEKAGGSVVIRAKKVTETKD
jgi:large subunit ribosomal protein L15